MLSCVISGQSLQALLDATCSIRWLTTPTPVACVRTLECVKFSSISLVTNCLPSQSNLFPSPMLYVCPFSFPMCSSPTLSTHVSFVFCLPRVRFNGFFFAKFDFCIVLYITWFNLVLSVEWKSHIGKRPFRESQSKTMKAYVQSGQYHTIVESRVHLTW